MSGPDRKVEYRGTGFYVGLVAILLFALVLLVIAVQNTQEVDVDFFDFFMPGSDSSHSTMTTSQDMRCFTWLHPVGRLWSERRET